MLSDNFVDNCNIIIKTIKLFILTKTVRQHINKFTKKLHHIYQELRNKIEIIIIEKYEILY